MRRWWVGLCLALLLCTLSVGATDDRRRSPFPRTSVGTAIARGDLSVTVVGMRRRGPIASSLIGPGHVRCAVNVGAGPIAARNTAVKYTHHRYRDTQRA
jgi:hypothetical protein